MDDVYTEHEYGKDELGRTIIVHAKGEPVARADKSGAAVAEDDASSGEEGDAKSASAPDNKARRAATNKAG